jgi:thermitase
MKKLSIVVALVLALLLSMIGGLAAAQVPDDTPGYAPDHILVKFQPGTPDEAKANAHQRLGGKVVGAIPGIDVAVVSVPQNQAAEKARAYGRENNVKFAEPDYIAKAILTPDDPNFGYQWGMTKIQAPEAWSVTTGSSDVRIAILDTGVDLDHEDLATRVVANKNFTTSSTVNDLYGHGTHCAGIAAAIANNSIGVAGVGFNTSLMNGKVLDDSGSGYYSWIASGLTWATDNGAKVISMSLGGSSSSSTLENAVNYAWGKGVVVVAAAGNSGKTAPIYPAYYANCISVAATDQNDAKASFSTYGSWVDVAAPGVIIYSTLPNHSNSIGTRNYGSLSGTSMATPHVAGLAGLVWSTSYGTSNTSVRSRIESTADAIAGTGTYWQYGRINANTAVTVDTTPPILSNIAASNITSSSADVTWTTNESSDSLVEYGTTQGSHTSSVYNGQLVTNHKVTLTSLQASTLYYYRVTSVDSAKNKAISGDQNFTTLTGPAPDFSISASPRSETVRAGTSTKYTVTLTALNGYSVSVNLSVSGLPSGAIGSFSRNPVTPTSSGTTSTLTVTTMGTRKGTYTLTITGTGTDAARITHATNVTLKIR